MKLRFEGITATTRTEFITVRLYAEEINCGLVTMFQDDLATIALRPPRSELVQTEVVMTEGTVDDFLRSVLGTPTKAA